MTNSPTYVDGFNQQPIKVGDKVVQVVTSPFTEHNLLPEEFPALSVSGVYSDGCIRFYETGTLHHCADRFKKLEPIDMKRLYYAKMARPPWHGIVSVDTPDSKPTNPKDAVGIKKFAMSTIPANVLGEVSLGNMEGSLKYGRHNYRDAGVRTSVYYDAAMRHLMAWWEGQDIDPESGVNHITKAICGLIVLRDSMMRNNHVDDRPPKSDESIWVELNNKAAKLIEKYPNPKKAFTNE